MAAQEEKDTNKVMHKQEVKLIFASPLWLVSNAINYLENDHSKTDTLVKDVIEFDYCPYCNAKLENWSDEYEYIKGCKVCNKCFDEHIGHNDFNLIKKTAPQDTSVLEHSLMVFHMRLTTAALLEMSRFNCGVTMSLTCSKDALVAMEGKDIELKHNDSGIIDTFLDKAKKNIEYGLINFGQSMFDDIVSVLPQAFLQKGQFTFNLKTLILFLDKCKEPSAHKDIKEIAELIIKELPNEYKDIVTIKHNGHNNA